MLSMADLVNLPLVLSPLTEAGWAELKLKNGDTAISSIGGVDLIAVQTQTGHPKLGPPRVRRRG